VNTDRLSFQHPSVSAALDAIPPDRLREVVSEVASAAAEACGVAAACERADDPVSLVAALDEAAWTAQERGDLASYEAAFRRARAADAWAQSITVGDRKTAGEALYEAVHAFGADAEAEATVVRLIRS
jgi:hypothetical protein